MSKEIHDAIDRAFGLTPEVRAKLADIVKELYPSRAERTLANITARAENLYVRDEWELTRNMIANLATLEPVLTRRVPTVDDVLAYRAAEREKRGLSFTAEDKISALRTASAMSDEDRLCEVPADWKIAAPVKKETPVAAPMNDTDRLDAMVLERYGKTKHEISAMDRRRYHDALRKDLQPDKLAERTIENAKAAESVGRTLGPAERMAAYRAAEKLKAG